MAAVDATQTPVKGQAYRLYGAISNVTTGKVITGGLTSLACSLSKDGAAFTSSTNAPVEIGTTGFFYVDLTATEMDASAINLKFSATNTNAVDQAVCIVTADLTRYTTNAWNQTPVRTEQLLAQIHGRQTCTYQITNTGVFVLDPVTNNIWLQGTISIGANGQRGRLG